MAIPARASTFRVQTPSITSGSERRLGGLTDLELARAIHGGDEAAVAALMDAHYADVYRFISQSRIGREDAEDLTQQTFVSACRAMGAFRGDSGLRTFLHKIAIREVYGWRRRFRLNVPLNGHEHAEDRMGRLEDSLVLLDALDRIPDRYRIAFQLFEVQQLSVVEVAQAMAIPVGTVKSHLSQARRRLRELLQTGQETITDARTEEA
jgi:RNA polymerase sigma-70 factor (ECF subfamily)